MENKIKIARGLPTLTYADFGNSRFTVEETLSFVNECKNLEYFQLELVDPKQIDQLLELLGSGWDAQPANSFTNKLILKKK